MKVFVFSTEYAFLFSKFLLAFMFYSFGHIRWYARFLIISNIIAQNQTCHASPFYKNSIQSFRIKAGKYITKCNLLSTLTTTPSPMRLAGHNVARKENPWSHTMFWFCKNGCKQPVGCRPAGCDKCLCKY